MLGGSTGNVYDDNAIIYYIGHQSQNEKFLLKPSASPVRPAGCCWTSYQSQHLGIIIMTFFSIVEFAFRRFSAGADSS